jgi:hypothetical protein
MMKVLYFLAYITIASPVGVGPKELQTATKDIANVLLDTPPVRRPRSASIHSFEEAFPYRTFGIMSGTVKDSTSLKGQTEPSLSVALKRKFENSGSIPEQESSEILKKPRSDYHIPNSLTDTAQQSLLVPITAKKVVQPSFVNGQAPFDGISGEYPPLIVTKTQKYYFDKVEAEGVDINNPQIIEKVRSTISPSYSSVF